MLRDTFLAGGFRRTEAGEKERVEAILDLLGITSVAGREVAGLPLGISRLVEIARAVATIPSVLLLDEPMSGLSSAEAAALADALRQLVATQKLSILLVEHDVPMVLDLCATVVVLDYGQVIANGTADDVRRDAAVQAAYFGDLSIGAPGSGAP
jgi:ABC-type branched-subunit amino acid transport system ATPase component